MSLSYGDESTIRPEVGGLELFLRKSMMQCHLKFLEASRKKYDAISSGIHERLILSLSTCSKLHRIAPNSLLASLARVFASNSLLAS